MVPSAVARAGFMATAYGWLTAASYTLPFAFTCGVCFWLVCGGFPSLQYRALFAALHSSGRGPKNYLAFLDWASSRLILSTTGSALRFPHREIQKYLSTTWRAQS